MKKELDEALCRDFPLLYRDRHKRMDITAMCWGFQCGDGWEPLIRRMSAKIEPLITQTPGWCGWCSESAERHRGTHQLLTLLKSIYGQIEFAICKTFKIGSKWRQLVPRYAGCQIGYDPTGIRATTVKEKFGILRFYMQGSLPEIEEAVNAAAEESSRTCEVCGDAGVLRDDGGWLATACDRHGKGDIVEDDEEEAEDGE